MTSNLPRGVLEIGPSFLQTQDTKMRHRASVSPEKWSPLNVRRDEDVCSVVVFCNTGQGLRLVFFLLLAHRQRDE